MGCCEMCGVPLIAWSHTGARTSYQPHSIHHRQPRGMGGTSRLEINSPANLLLVCGTGTSGCHGWIESNRTEAYTFGLLVGAGADTAAVPLLLEGGDWYFHDHDGGRRPDPRWRPA